jgi:regulator of protease activity HflC (stomatin/prohibitin superfamily)
MLILAFAIIVASFIIGNEMKKSKVAFGKWIPIIGLILAAGVIALNCISYVPTGYTGIVTTFGKVHENTLDAGINFHAPWDNVITMDNREQRSEFKLEAFSKDIQQVDIQGSINYNIDKSTAMNLYRDVGTSYASILINPRIQEDVKIVIAQYTAENLISNRQAAADSMLELLKTELEPKGINVISFAVENIDFTDAFESAVEAKQVATQEKQRAQTQQEQQTMEAEQAAKRKKIEAEAAAEVQKIEADATAYAIKAKADAEAEANKKLNSSITAELINYNQILKWNGALPTFIGGDGVMPILNFGGAE